MNSDFDRIFQIFSDKFNRTYSKITGKQKKRDSVSFSYCLWTLVLQCTFSRNDIVTVNDIDKPEGKYRRKRIL